MRANLKDRFETKYIPEPMSGCWLWLAYADKDGYGKIYANGRQRGAHRVSYSLSCGRIPDGALVLHKCDNPICVNPDHLYLGIHTDNMRDKSARGRNTNAQKQHCPRGHLYSEKNTYISARGSRICRTCHRERVSAKKRENSELERAKLARRLAGARA